MFVATNTLKVVPFWALGMIPLLLFEAFMQVIFSQFAENSLRLCSNFLHCLESSAPQPPTFFSVLETWKSGRMQGTVNKENRAPE